MPGKHQITGAGSLFLGAGYHPGAYARYARRGAPVNIPTLYEFGVVATAVATAICAAQAVAGAVDLNINGTLASGGVATNDIARGIRAVSANAGDTTQTLTITGTDIWGDAVKERITLNGTTIVNGKKAFKTVTKVTASAATAGNISVGNTAILGLPFKLAKKGDCFRVTANGVDEFASATVVVADTNTATLTTGDVRGTILPNTAPNGSVEFQTIFFVRDPSTRDTLTGVAQFSG